MRRFVGMGLALTSIMLAPALALADDETPPPLLAGEATTTESPTATVDTVHLRSGGLFRGRVTEILPGDHVTVNLPSGEARRIPWADVERVIVASTPVPPPPTASAPPTPSPSMVGPRAIVHIKSSGRVTLYRRAAGTTELVRACDSPCDAALPLGDGYRIGGRGITTTNEFRLAAKPGGSVELTVDGPNWGGIVGGGLLTIGGGVTAYVGALFALAGASCAGCRATKSIQNAGFGALAVGAAMIGVGLLIVFPSLKTDLSQETSAPSRDAFVRTPTWRTAGVGAEGRPMTTTFSLLEGSF